MLTTKTNLAFFKCSLMLTATLQAACSSEVCTIGVPASGPEIVLAERFPSGQISGLGATRGNNKTGYWLHWDSSGQLRSAGVYQDGLASGRWIKLHQNGQVESGGLYDEGKRYGSWVFFDPNGNVDIVGSGFYKDDRRLRALSSAEIDDSIAMLKTVVPPVAR